MRIVTSFIVALSFILLGCGGEEQSSDNLHQDTGLDISQPDVHKLFAWLEGTWMRATSRGEIYEKWQTDDSGLTGIGFRLREGDTVISERTWLVIKGSDIYYVAHPQENLDPTSFRMIRQDSLTMTFENPNHDFPTMITYLYKPPDSLVATIEGPAGDSTRKIDFAYKRIE